MSALIYTLTCKITKLLWQRLARNSSIRANKSKVRDCMDDIKMYSYSILVQLLTREIKKYFHLSFAKILLKKNRIPLTKRKWNYFLISLVII